MIPHSESADGQPPDALPRVLTPPRIAAIVAGSVAFVIYLRTLLPGVSFGDWAEMQLVPPQFGTLHPSGFPLYVVLGKLFSLVPLGSVAFRANLLSAVTAAAAVGAAVLIASRLGVRPVIAALVGLALAVTATMWQAATIAEVNALHLLLLAAVIHRALVWRAERRDRDILLGALLVGLSLANHPLAATAVPIVALFVLADGGLRRLVASPILAVRAALATVAGLSFYLLIPLRALAGPPEVYGILATWDGFWHHVRAEQFSRDMDFWSGERVAALVRALPDVIGTLVSGSSPVFVVAAIAGAVALLIRDRRPGLLLSALAAINIYFFVNYMGNLYHYLLLTWLIAALWVGVIAEGAVRALSRADRRLAGAQFALVLLPISIAVGQWDGQDNSRHRAGDAFATEVFGALPAEAVLVTYWDAITTLSYKHCIEGLRPDVALRTYHPFERVTCDDVSPSLEDEARRGRPVYALFAHPEDLDRLRESFDLVQGPRLLLPSSPTRLGHAGLLYRLVLKASPAD